MDTVYAHVLAWQLAFAEAGMPIDGWRLHRRMGMSGGLFKRAVMRELGRTISLPRLEMLDKRHGELFHRFLPKPRPLPVPCPGLSNCSGSCAATKWSTGSPLQTSVLTSIPPWQPLASAKKRLSSNGAM